MGELLVYRRVTLLEIGVTTYNLIYNDRLGAQACICYGFVR